MRLKYQLLLAAFVLVAIASCSKKSTSDPTPDNKQTLPPTNTSPDVYTAGYVIASNGKTVATYWKNGVATRLGDSTLSSAANEIVVDHNDVYVAGVTSTV